MIRFLLPLGLFLPLVPVQAQPTADSLDADSADTSPRLYRTIDERSLDRETIRRTAERLTDLARHPLDVNHATAADLSVIPSLSPSLARRLVQYRKEHGPFSQIRAITAVEGIDARRLQSLRPYLKAKRSSTGSNDGLVASLNTLVSNLEVNVLQRMTRRLDLGRGFDDDSTRTTFRGSPVQATTRLRLQSGRRAQIALTLDKDAGEKLRWNPQTSWYGFDHAAGNVTLRDLGPVETLVLGNFTTQFGQGVALWQGLTLGKGRDPVSPLVRSGRGVAPFQSSSENHFFRGVAATLSVTPSLRASAFVSRRQRDATLDSLNTSGAETEVVARTLSTGGRHRTAGERQGRNALGSTTVGGGLAYQTPSFHVGASGYRSQFDRPFRPPDQPYRHFDLSGRRSSLLSAYGSAFVGDYTLFGEVARTPAGRYAGLAGASLDHAGGVQALLLGRRFPPSFQGPYSSTVGESGSSQNEIGVYTGLRVQVAENWQISAYVDQYRSPWLRFNVPRPSRGLDTRVVAEYEPRPWLSSSVQVRADRAEAGTERPGPHGRSLAALSVERRQTVRWQTEYAFNETLTLRTRLQGSRVSAEGAASHGFFLSQGLRFTPLDGVRVDARLALFDTDDYDARIYAYEHDLLYSFSVPVLYGRGQRSYLLLQYAPTSAFTLEAKYGATWYPTRRTIGSGQRATSGPRRREIRVQIRWSL